MSGFNASCLNAIYYNSMFSYRRPFLLSTCELLVWRFGGGSPYLSFEQFCLMMQFLKEQKSRFATVDVDKSGALDLNELGRFFAISGTPMLPGQVREIARRYDLDSSGQLQFDEFLHMMIEWDDIASSKRRFWMVVGVLATLVFGTVAITLRSFILAFLAVLSLVLLLATGRRRSHWGEIARTMPVWIQRVSFQHPIWRTALLLSLSAIAVSVASSVPYAMCFAMAGLALLILTLRPTLRRAGSVHMPYDRFQGVVWLTASLLGFSALAIAWRSLTLTLLALFTFGLMLRSRWSNLVVWC